MTFLAPISAILAAALVLPALVLMYFLKLRRRQVDVPTTLLWRKSVQDMQASAPFQKLRRNLLLILQCLLLIGLLVALARPMVDGWAVTGRRVVIVIDHSASMSATDVSPSRLSHARELALQLASQASQGQGVMIVSLAHDAQIVEPFTTDRGRLTRAIQSIAATDEPGRISQAITLLEQFARQETGLDIYLLSDGRFDDAKDVADVTLEGQAVFQLLKVHGEQLVGNQGVVTLSARRDPLSPDQVEVFVGLANDAPDPAPLTLAVKINGQLVRLISVTAQATPPGDGGDAGLPAMVITPVSFTTDQAGHFIVEVSIQDHDDALLADNRAWVVVTPRQSPEVVVVGRHSPFLLRALEAAGVSQVQRWTPQAYEAAARRQDGLQAYDLIVFDGYEPAALPARAWLSLGAGMPPAGIERHQEPARQGMGILSWRRDHPVLRYAGLDELIVADQARLALPGDASMLAAAQSGPVIALRDSDGLRGVVVGFDPMHSNWPLQVGFPVFVSNAVQWLCATQMAQGGWLAQPGQAVVVPLRGGEMTPGSHAVYEGPATLTGTMQPAGLTLTPPRRVGVYRTDDRAISPPWDRLPVSLLDRTESDLRPAGVLVLGSQSVQAVEPQRVRVRQPVHQWFLIAALVLLLGEWLLYVRRNRL